ncbi:hypothetical protein QLQ12_10320 [Actinoplanes sp. NEAU-A12]|uniref:Uncharacterized protein n=1 Tax=Actinoplanes sandaracinus TaxID=3045177 RepID=A0ABT6WH06_9ACTN|nr:hypothetical protein [Actinoplanes sandaracinus]MDI6098995.1 hypothetical protein [Actinoplanes sandaracinus]
MGLSISVGNPAVGDAEGEEHYRQAITALARALAEEGATDWTPPAPGAAEDSAPLPAAGFPYGYLHRLRRVFALHVEGQPVTPVTSAADLDAADGYIDDATSMLNSHLLCHSDTSGYYVPAPLDDPVFLAPDTQVAGGGIVGSCQDLLDELHTIAPVIGIRPEATGATADDDPFAVEQLVWRALYDCCQASIATGRPVVFH